MPSIVSEEQVKQYAEKGAICLRGIFHEGWVDVVRLGIERNLAHPSPYSERLKTEGGTGAYFNDYCNWTQITEFENYALYSPAAQVAGELMQSTYSAFYHEHVLVKEPGTTKVTPWHHDQSYYPIDGFKVCSIWMPVDHIPENTCVQFVAGSHKWDWYFPRKFATGLPYPVNGSPNDHKCYKPVPEITDEHEILQWNLEPGDCIVFHMRTLHGAPGNVSLERSRRVLSTRWLGDDAVIASRPWDVSPPTLGGLNVGDKAESKEFPIVWEKDRSLTLE